MTPMAMSDQGELEQPGGVVAARTGEAGGPGVAGGSGAGDGGERRQGILMPRGDGGLGVAQVAERDGVPAIGLVDVEEAEVVLVELGGRRPEAAGGVGFGAEDRADAARVGPAGQVGAQLGAVLVALVGLLAHQLADDRGEGRRDAAGDRFRAARGLPSAA